MKRVLPLSLGLFVATIAFPGCSGSTTASAVPGSSTQTSAFLGTWVYQSGSTSTDQCPMNPMNVEGGVGDGGLSFGDAGGLGDASVIGKALPIDGQPLEITVTADGKLQAVETGGDQCKFAFDVSGRTATGMPYQTCPDGRFGADGGGPGGFNTIQLVLVSATLTLSDDGTTITEDASEQAYSICTLAIHGTLRRMQ